MAKHYNFIYEELVRYEGDLVGRVAYSLYKREKIAFLFEIFRCYFTLLALCT